MHVRSGTSGHSSHGWFINERTGDGRRPGADTVHTPRGALRTGACERCSARLRGGRRAASSDPCGHSK
eukprot:12815600-Alexandrium_andersonii.AAC.1